MDGSSICRAQQGILEMAKRPPVTTVTRTRRNDDIEATDTAPGPGFASGMVCTAIMVITTELGQLEKAS
jgi:hypothetical protein